MRSTMEVPKRQRTSTNTTTIIRAKTRTTQSGVLSPPLSSSSTRTRIRSSFIFLLLFFLSDVLLPSPLSRSSSSSSTPSSTPCTNGVHGLVLLPMPGFYLSSTLHQQIQQRRRRISTTTNRNRNKNRNNPRHSRHSSTMTTRIIRSVLHTDQEESSKMSSPHPPPSTGTATTYVAVPPSVSASRAASEGTGGTSTITVTGGTRGVTSQRDVLISRAAKIRQSVVRQQDELLHLERQIECCSRIDGTLSEYDFERTFNNPRWNSNMFIPRLMKDLSPSKISNGVVNTFRASSNVLVRKIQRVQQKIGPNNQQWNGNVGDYVIHELFAGLRIATSLVKSPSGIKKLIIDPKSPTLVAHIPAILARLDKLEYHVSPILEQVLNNRQHLASIEPYLDEILERFDDIEPHLPWILENIDALAPYTGLLLKHVDALLLFANCDDINPTAITNNNNNDGDSDSGDDDTDKSLSSSSSSYSLADQLLPYLEYYVSNLDVIGPHLVLLRPHVPLLLNYNYLAKVSPHIDKLFARGYETQLTASANIDVLLFWCGWTLRIPYVAKIFFALPFSPRIVSFLANRLPKKFARKGKSYCRNLECAIDPLQYGSTWNKLDKA